MDKIKYISDDKKVPCYFDRLNDYKKPELTEEQKRNLELRNLEAKRRKEEWLEKSSIVDGIPGRCVVVDRGDQLVINSSFIDKKFINKWQEDSGSILYYYSDLQPLSGSIGYILLTSIGKKLQYITVRS